MKKSITRRWVYNNLALVALILIVIELAMMAAIQNYYYGSARQYMFAKLNSVRGVLTRYAGDNTLNFPAEMRKMVESFSDKDKMELMALDAKGNVLLSSSGFQETSKVDTPDFRQALNTQSGTSGYYAGRLKDGEKVMALSYSLADISGEYSVIRVVSSTAALDGTIISFVIAISIISLAILLIISFMGMYFLRSIIQPVKEISLSTEKFSLGDFSERIPLNNSDEIGQLAAAINHMADELAATETMKNEFISSVSHELRTPLTAIKGWADTINNEQLIMYGGGEHTVPENTDLELNRETIRKGLKIIITESERLSNMVEELLDFSRLQSGHFSLNLEKMDIIAELEEALLIYGEKAKKERIQLDYTPSDIFPIINGDRNRIKQVFINIIDNAIKYSNPDEGVVTIGAEKTDTDVTIIVADNGIGIRQEDLPKIKTKFFKANQTRRGAGIGLAVANEIVTMHGGTLEVQSEENEGTNVIITIPLIVDITG